MVESIIIYSISSLCGRIYHYIFDFIIIFDFIGIFDLIGMFDCIEIREYVDCIEIREYVDWRDVFDLSVRNRNSRQRWCTCSHNRISTCIRVTESHFNEVM